VFSSKIGGGKLGEASVCKLYKKVAFSHVGPKEAIFTRLRCKQWSCEYCAKKNQWVWRNWLLKRLPEVSDEWWLLTLTANRWKRAAWSSMDNIRKHLDAFFKRMKRVFGSIEYVRVYEKHPTSQAIHCHIIVSGVTPYVALGYSVKFQAVAYGVFKRVGRDGFWALRTWVKKTAQALDMGFIADIKKLIGDPEQASWYVTKYLTKAQSELHVKGLRHVQVTRGIGSPPSDDTKIWQVSSYIVPRMFAPNAVVKDLNTGQAIDNAYWEIHDFYPYDD
jgi:hypothetical protein